MGTVAATRGESRSNAQWAVSLELTLGSKTETKDQADGEKCLPGVGKARCDGRNDQDDRRDENLSASAEPVVQRIRHCIRFSWVVLPRRLGTHARRLRGLRKCTGPS